MMNLSAVMQGAVNDHVNNSPRSQQKTLGISDIGGCREYGRLKVTEAEQTNDRDRWAAFVGTAIHDKYDLAVKEAYGDQVKVGYEVTCTYPNGATMVGHPDWVFPSRNLVVDLKSVDGLHAIRKTGPTNRQWMQVMSYGKALLDEGTFASDVPVNCALAYVDRSAREAKPEFFMRELDLAVLSEASDWITDVIYAVRNDEPASKDRPIDWCERFCEFYTSCRAGDAAPEGGLIEDPNILAAIDVFLEGQALERRGKAMKDEAKGQLEGVEGSTGTATVRWTYVGPSEIPGYVRDGYKKINVRAVK